VKRLIFLMAAISSLRLLATPHVDVVRTPNNGIQPQVAVASDGTVHLIYYKGDARAGNVFYVHQKADAEKWSAPIQVNSQSGSAIAVGTIRGAQLAVGKNNRVHVIWNGSSGASKTTINHQEITPLLYTRLNDAGTAFEPERNLITAAAGLDGGSSIAADSMGNVYAAWHAKIPGSPKEGGEQFRAVFISRSTDQGKTFSAETQAIKEPTGACGCCGMRAFADRQGAVYILYRGAEEKVNRDEVLLISPKPGAPFQIANRHPWKIETCPMSSAYLTQSGPAVLAAWETAGQVFFTSIDSAQNISKPFSPPGSAKRKHPLAISNDKGDILLAWTEGTAWEKGGSAVCQLFDSNLKPTAEPTRADNLPVWSLVTAYPKPNGDFVVIY
jgi:hypothetical protein